jgi:hypothetical protein
MDAVCVSAGRSASRPFCWKGSVAMKMTSSTSNTSMSGVMFISELARRALGFTSSLDTAPGGIVPRGSAAEILQETVWSWGTLPLVVEELLAGSSGRQQASHR